jgi:alpha-galactosidase
MAQTKITVIGAGSASFGLNTLGSFMRSKLLRGCHLALVDRNETSLGLIHRLAQRLNQEWDAGMTLSIHTSHKTALPGSHFVISAIEVPPREELWKSDFELTLKYGVRQPYAENGGPGGFAHTARNIGPILAIAKDMEEACPDAWFINFSNPMTRVCLAISQYTKIKVVGLCHQIYHGYGMAGYLLAEHIGIDLPKEKQISRADPAYWEIAKKIMRQAKQTLDIKAAGLNHFTWLLDIRDRRTGEDLYPLLRENAKKAPPDFEPLTMRVFDSFGLFPIPGDSHLDEYLPWCSDPQTKPWEKYNLYVYDWDGAAQGRRDGHEQIRQMGEGQLEIDHLKEFDSEGALEIVEAAVCGENNYHVALNLPNQGQISNLPVGAVVETPGILTNNGPMPVNMGALPLGVAELLRREYTVGKLAVDASVTGDRGLALQCLLLDPVITDLDVARLILDDYLTTYKQYLPSFWK